MQGKSSLKSITSKCKSSIESSRKSWTWATPVRLESATMTRVSHYDSSQPLWLESTSLQANNVIYQEDPILTCGVRATCETLFWMFALKKWVEFNVSFCASALELSNEWQWTVADSRTYAAATTPNKPTFKKITVTEPSTLRANKFECSFFLKKRGMTLSRISSCSLSYCI